MKTDTLEQIDALLDKYKYAMSEGVEDSYRDEIIAIAIQSPEAREYLLPLEIELGHGNKLVTDIFDPDGEWAGIAISDGECPIGEVAETGAEVVSDLKPELTIVTSNPDSLRVIIAACERAIEALKEAQSDE